MKKYPVLKDKQNLKDKFYRATVSDTSLLPKQTNNAILIDWVFDQGQQGSCTGNALASLKMYRLKQAGVPFVVVSRSYIYWHERLIEGTISQDSGAYPRDGMKVLNTLGVCTDSLMPYHDTDFTTKPSALAETEAAKYKISEYHRIADASMLKAALAAGDVVALGMLVYNSFESQKVATTGIVPTPKRGEQQLGGHEVLIVDYYTKGTTTYYKILNSWGKNWGQNGYFVMTEATLKKLMMDMWTGK
jgi:C1A family cysteine protease